MSEVCKHEAIDERGRCECGAVLLHQPNAGNRPSNPGFEPLRLEFPDGSVQILYMAGQVDPEIDRLTRREAELVKALERLAQRRDRHHDCGDYERGYGDAEASASAIARAALKEPTT